MKRGQFAPTKGGQFQRFFQYVLFQGAENEWIKNLVEQARKYRIKRSQSRIHVVLESRHGLGLRSLSVKKPKLSLSGNYNDDLIEEHRIIMQKLSKKNEKGLVLLHGEPGTGKSYYIRYLISLLKKPVIFLPPDLARSLTRPDFLPLLVERPNSILVIEDAENLIIDRNSNENSPVSALLNISDGLLSDCLNIQVICTFNTDLSRIDPALMRKGRLISRYEFKALSEIKAKALVHKLGCKMEISGATQLNAIYNWSDRQYDQKQRKEVIGFGARSKNK